MLKMRKGLAVWRKTLIFAVGKTADHHLSCAGHAHEKADHLDDCSPLVIGY
jgi:hypothetical protein